jgi:hypothetical protein
MLVNLDLPERSKRATRLNDPVRETFLGRGRRYVGTPPWHNSKMARWHLSERSAIGAPKRDDYVHLAGEGSVSLVRAESGRSSRTIHEMSGR